ncbi:CinA family protein [Candidatus Aquiluna sp. UB-MaderosW2red]|uniref:CinA family protein n=1 Tax=Candidatus Aquiluna sp. UB-MaderosW2red TaxID=1855377 RepID=UPI000875B65A|nr:CinA family protein [Candidatus Aquiluna sp. UB-MaderosW2red]SCX13357.1 nicotinamide-nucleotide amidase/nicotinamide-nucleotide amidase [Candidatus Aquiluna sp. UB-MaderosW2red]
MTLIERLEKKGLFLAIAESVTGGLICARLIDTPGASRVVLGGIVAYQNDVKQNLLGVPSELLAKVGPVDSKVAMIMATSVRDKFALANTKNISRVIGLSSTGVAGPDPVGRSEVGEVLIGFSSSRGAGHRAFQFQGDREQIRSQSLAAALLVLGEHLDEFWGLESGNSQIH